MTDSPSVDGTMIPEQSHRGQFTYMHKDTLLVRSLRSHKNLVISCNQASFHDGRGLVCNQQIFEKFSQPIKALSQVGASCGKIRLCHSRTNTNIEAPWRHTHWPCPEHTVPALSRPLTSGFNAQKIVQVLGIGRPNTFSIRLFLCPCALQVLDHFRLIMHRKSPGRGSNRNETQRSYAPMRQILILPKST